MPVLPFSTLLLSLMLWPAAAFSGQKPEEPPTAEHEQAMRRAQVWLEPAIPIEQAKPGENPQGPGHRPRQSSVRSSPLHGREHAKFDCELQNGDKVKVKYGRDNAEIYAVAGSRRLTPVLPIA
jgi:hypothetical protein